MQTTVTTDPMHATTAHKLVPLHLDHAMPANGAPIPTGVNVAFDPARQITFWDGVPISEMPPSQRGQVTTSNIRSDGTRGAIDTGQPDDATPNA
ncbi:hypothetical protein LO772_21530 [Yinghuangia sp. ASG 101]|uniref:hypothetical protein n=1 Tax=Yinghuangia sp. ASG 101 TaxID=2896848 RepID=UPI001E606BBB|nr:hypothetical protein [Yinghuangia sp. ASG 101]UGQ09513.1 hypothetical protein LO772_21530 [Yinghuangia sp. ASG 101]